ncbi:NAD(+)--dinitrogen-reductase ADP-D-ribosyltransferase [Magnetovibrio sp. PR-2]|uniref:NAD(+)--dinitrogen-reductase ADP-D-ribosyltransferase n=1 Tax=Magnetovibrio sp. PR-2 TaxID=3120356 RepID=UPI002FCE4EC9
MNTTLPPQAPKTTLPAAARLGINRCNLPAVILGSLTFQDHPEPLHIDGVKSFHGDLFQRLDALNDFSERAQQFQDYMAVTFRLDAPEDVGATKDTARTNADYLRLLRGWFFNTDGREGAVIKSWVESRFGLLTRHHGGPVYENNAPAMSSFLKDRAHGLHNTNALEAQLDLLYTYTQYELSRAEPFQPYLTLYRGVNKLDGFEVLDKIERSKQVLLLNNVNSFSTDRDMACAFGDYILTVKVPFSKIVFFSGLLPGCMKGENEYLVLGGVYEVGVAVF